MTPLSLSLARGSLGFFSTTLPPGLLEGSPTAERQPHCRKAALFDMALLGCSSTGRELNTDLTTHQHKETPKTGILRKAYWEGQEKLRLSADDTWYFNLDHKNSNNSGAEEFWSPLIETHQGAKGVHGATVKVYRVLSEALHWKLGETNTVSRKPNIPLREINQFDLSLG